MGVKFGLEAIDYQVNSKLSSELIQIFQEVIDYKSKLNGTIRYIVTEVETFVLKVTLKKLAIAIYKHTGIPVSKLYVSKAFSAMFACCVDFGEDDGVNMYTTIKRYSGIELTEMEQEYIDSLKVKKFTAEELEKLSNNFNVKSGKMNIRQLAGKDISLHLYFDYNAAFLVKETAHVKCEPLTAEEITAIVLHEIGHMLTMFEHAGDAYFKASVDANIMINKFLIKDNAEEVLKYGFNFLEKTFPDKKKLIDALKDKFLKTLSPGKGEQSKSLGTIGSLLLVAFISMLTLVFSGLFLPLRIIGSVFIPMVNTLENTKKLSDYAELKKQFKYCEQLADEFVARHGLSRGLASGLQKLFAWFEITQLGVVSHNSSLVWAAAKTPFIIMTMFYGDLTDGGGAYDREYDRVTRGMTNLLSIFKNENLPKEALDFYINDFEATKAAIAGYNKRRRFTEIMYTVHNICRYILMTPIESLFTGRFLDEYNKLHDNAEMLKTNTMFYHSMKLKQILSRLKK